MSPAILILVGLVMIWLVWTGKAAAVVKALLPAAPKPAS